jgi:hypothetical protein
MFNAQVTFCGYRECDSVAWLHEWGCAEWLQGCIRGVCCVIIVRTNVPSGFLTCYFQVLYNLRPQALSSDDLDGTAYDVRKETEQKIKQRQKPVFHVFRWTIGLGLLCAAVIVGRRVQIAL